MNIATVERNALQSKYICFIDILFYSTKVVGKFEKFEKLVATVKTNALLHLTEHDSYHIKYSNVGRKCSVKSNTK